MLAIALSLALISFSSSSIRTVSIRSSSLIILLMIWCSSWGSLLSNSEERRLLYKSEEIPKDLRLHTRASTRSYKWQRPFKFCCEVTGLALNRMSICRVIICLLSLNCFFMVICRHQGKAWYRLLSCAFQERLQIIEFINIRELRILVYSCFIRVPESSPGRNICSVSFFSFTQWPRS